MKHAPAPDATAADGAQPAGEGHGQGIDPLLLGILHLLWEAPGPGWVSLPRLTKRLGASGSAVLRTLTLLSSAQWGDRQGYGWVEVRQDDTRWLARLSGYGRTQCQGMFAPADAVQVPGVTQE